MENVEVGTVINEGGRAYTVSSIEEAFGNLWIKASDNTPDPNALTIEQMERSDRLNDPDAWNGIKIKPEIANEQRTPGGLYLDPLGKYD